MKKWAVSLVMASALLALTAAPAAAQNSELGVGFVSQNSSWNGCCAFGFGVDFAQAIRSTDTMSIAIIGDVYRVRFSDGGSPAFTENDASIVGGVRFKFLRDRRVAVFVQGTAGVLPWSDSDGDSGTDVLIGGGGGIQIRLTDMLDAKIQVDAWADNDDGTWYSLSRWFFGATFKFGPK